MGGQGYGGEDGPEILRLGIFFTKTLLPNREAVPIQHYHVAEIKCLTPHLFPGRLSPAGTFLGEDPVLERGIGLNSDLRNGTLTLGRSVEQRRLQDRPPDF